MPKVRHGSYPFPFYQQKGKVDCGPACLYMIAKYKGIKCSIKYITELCHLSEKGVTLLSLQSAAKTLGLTTEGVRMDAEELFTGSYYPCIVHWSGGHFVVLPPQPWNPESILVADPGLKAARWINREMFLARWLNDRNNGYALLFPEAPSQPVLKPDWNIKKFVPYAKLLKPLTRYLILLILLLLLNSGISFLAPLINRNIFDIGIDGRALSYVALMVCCQLLLFIGASSIEVIKSFILVRVNNELSIKLTGEFIGKLLKLPLSFFDGKHMGEFQLRLGDLSRIQYFITSYNLSIIINVFNFIAFFIALSLFSYQVLLITLVFSFFEIVWLLGFMKRRNELDKIRFNRMSGNHNDMSELIFGIHEIKQNNIHSERLAAWEKRQVLIQKLNMENVKVEQKQHLGAGFINQLGSVIVTFLCAKAVISSEMTVGTMVSVTLVAGQLKGSLQQFQSLIRSYQDASLSLSRIDEIRAAEDEFGSIKQSGEDLGPLSSISLEKIGFQYPGASRAALENISFSISAGKTVSIVGGSGSGKSTLAKLISKQWGGASGNIWINQRENLNNIPAFEWRKRTGFIQQDGFIFSASIAENIALEEGFDIQTLSRVCKVAEILDFINSLPLGWDTPIGKAGKGISGGQRQRILLARALYRNPELLILDEATSALDPMLERQIMKNIENAYRGQTRIIISHRLHTVSRADKIIVLDQGRVVEVGQHQELLEKQGQYRCLFLEQLDSMPAPETTVP